MGNLDRFLAKSLESMIRNNLGGNAINKIENRLFEKYGISLVMAIEQFHKLDSTLREFFGAGADGIEDKIFNNVFELKKVQDKDNTESTSWIALKDPHLINLILDAFGDEDKKRICTSVTNEAKIIYKILNECQIPQTSAYRKINSLIKDGLLTVEGYSITSEGKKVNKYRFLFQNIRIDINKKHITIEAQLNKQSLEDSSILLLISELKS
jgi:hypothetical protein